MKVFPFILFWLMVFPVVAQQRTILTANSVAELVTIAPSGPADAYVASYYAGIQGGGGTFGFDPASTVATNRGIVFKPLSSSGRWIREATHGLDAEMFGAKGDGVTDDTAPVQDALDAVAANKAGTLWLRRNYAVGNLNLASNIRIEGKGTGVLKQLSGRTSYVLSANAGDRGAANVSGNLTNIMIRNLKFRGLSDTAGFSEHHFLLNLNAVSDVLVEGCEFIAPQGDGIYLGSGNTPNIERHNQRIRINSCKFDGINYANRNGITVIDCDDLSIQGCYFTRLSTNTMPGAIDVEPDGNPWHIVREITVRSCVFDRNGGMYADLGVSIDASVTNFASRFTFTGNSFSSNRAAAFFFRSRQNELATHSNELVFSSNHISHAGGRPFVVGGANGVVLSGNVIFDATNQPILGLEAIPNRVYNATLSGNVFKEVQNDGLTIYAVSGLTLEGNIWQDCGDIFGTNGVGIRFRDARSTNVTLVNNQFFSVLGRTAYAIKVHRGYGFTVSSNWETGTVTCGVAGNDFQAANQGPASPSGLIDASSGAIYTQRPDPFSRISWVKGAGAGSIGWRLLSGKETNALVR